MRLWPYASGRDGLAWLLALTPLLLLLSGFHLALNLGRPFGGYLTARSLEGPRYFVDSITPTWWPGLAEGKIPREAELLALDGVPLDGAVNQSVLFQTAWDSGRRPVTVFARSSERPLTLNVPVVAFSLWHFLDLKLPYAIIAAALWLLAHSLYQASPADRLNRQTAFTLAVAALFLGLVRSSLFLDETVLTRLLDFLWVGVAWPLFGAALFHFTALYPGPGRLHARWSVLLIYGHAAALSAVWGAIRLANALDDRADWIGRLDHLCYTWCVWVWTAALLSFALRLAWNWLRPGNDRRVRRQVSVVLAGLIFSAVPISLWIGAAFGPGSSSLYLGYFDLRYFVLGTPLALAYVMLRYRAFRTFSRGFIAAYLITGSALIASAAAWVWRMVYPAPETAPPPFAPVFVAALLTGGLLSVRPAVAEWLARTLNLEFAGYDQARHFGDQLIGETRLDTLPQKMTEAVTTGLQLEQAAVWQWAEGELTLTGRAGAWPTALPGVVPLAVAELPARPLRLPEESAHLPPRLTTLGEAGAVIAYPLRVLTEPVGLLALGRRCDEDIYTDADLRVIELVAREAALLLLTARQLAQLRQMAAALQHSQEEERRRLAQELHDTVQQSLNGLTYLLAGVRRQSTDPERVQALAHEGEAEAREALHSLHQIRHDLDLSQLAESFTQPLGVLAAQFERRRGLRVQYQAHSEVDAALSLPARLALYRVVREALENAAKHAQAGAAEVAVWCENGRVRFEVRDDGRGSTAEARAQAARRGQLGLTGMRSRVESLGGQFELWSAPGAGTRVRGWVPSISPE